VIGSVDKLRREWKLEKKERETGNEVAGPVAFDGKCVSLSTLFWWSFERWVLLQKEKTTTQTFYEKIKEENETYFNWLICSRQLSR